MTASIRRKNNGKQFTCVDDKSRFIFHWHLPGDRLPLRLNHEGSQYLLREQDVEVARVSQRGQLLKVDVENLKGLALVPTMSLADDWHINAKGTTWTTMSLADDWHINAKGTTCTPLRSTKWDTAKSVAYWVSASGAAGLCAWEVVKYLAP